VLVLYLVTDFLIIFVTSWSDNELAGVGANSEHDLIRNIAPSALRQLGLVVGDLSVEHTEPVFLHLLIQSLFKYSHVYW
jgi:hypothetical protein